MRILLIIETLKTGGAEKFCIHLANYLASQEHEVYLFPVFYHKKDASVVQMITSRVHLVNTRLLADRLFDKIDELLFRFNIAFSARNVLVIRRIRRILKEKGIDLIHSHQFNSDYLALTSCKNSNICNVTTVHGDYLNFNSANNRGKKVYRNLDFSKKLQFIIGHIDLIVCLSDHQIHFFRELGYPLTNIRKIYNGFPLTKQPIVDESTGNKAFTFGMVARGIQEKGWEEAILAFLSLKGDSCQLILVGSSDYLDSLKKKYSSCPQITFTGYASQPQEWISKFDVGLLPTYYPSESLPTTIIEYLQCGKPIIASDTGEIRLMIEDAHLQAGIVIGLKDGKVNVEELKQAMQKLIEDEQLRERFEHNAIRLSGRFDINVCGEKYAKLFESLYSSKSKNGHGG